MTICEKYDNIQLCLNRNLLQKEKIISNITIQDLIDQKLVFAYRQIGEEIKAWLFEIGTNNINLDHAFLLSCAIPDQRDTLGFIYQSLLIEGDKSQSGSYYTPETIVNEIIRDFKLIFLPTLNCCKI